MPVSTNLLVKASVYIAVGGMGSVMVMRSLLLDKVRRTEYYQTAMKEIRNHEGAKSVLGEPIKEIGLDLGEPNYANSEKAHFEVQVKGPKAKGTMFFWADKLKESESWNVSRIELELKDDDKRLIIKKPAISY